MKNKLLFLLFISHSLNSISQVQLLKDFLPGGAEGQSHIVEFIEFNNQLYFNVNGEVNGNETGIELWKTDGTANGTVLVEDYSSGIANSNPSRFFLMGGTELVFIAENPAIGREWHRLNGSNIELIQDLNPSGSSIIYSPFAHGKFISSTGEEKILFRGNNTTLNNELFEYDFNSGTINLVGDFNGTSPSNPNWFRNFQADNSIMFSMQDTNLGNELFKYDGTSVVLVKDINPGNNSSSSQQFYEYQGEMYFYAIDEQEFGVINGELWKTDGTEQGTIKLKEINTNNTVNNASFPRDFLEFNGLLYFTADDGNGRELWRTDGTSNGTVRINVDPTTPNGSEPSDFLVTADFLYFSANRTVTGRELFAVSPSGAVFLVANIANGTNSSNPNGLIEYDGKIFMSADDGTTGRELWMYDPIDNSTSLFDIVPGLDGSFALNGSTGSNGSIVYNNQLYFVATTPTTGLEIFLLDANTLTTNQSIENSSLTLYPNPTSSSFSIAHNNETEIETIEVYDISGKLVKYFKGALNANYNVEELSKGLYFVKILSDSTSETIRLIKS